MTEPTVEEFLRIEDASSKLLDELTDLRKETVTLQQANASLVHNGQRLSELILATADAARENGETARVLRQIGTPEIMGKFAENEAEVRFLNDKLDQMDEAIKLLSTQSARGFSEAAQLTSKTLSASRILLGMSVLILLLESVAFLVRI